jgi:hypothetical protein
MKASKASKWESFEGRKFLRKLQVFEQARRRNSMAQESKTAFESIFRTKMVFKNFRKVLFRKFCGGVMGEQHSPYRHTPLFALRNLSSKLSASFLISCAK